MRNHFSDLVYHTLAKGQSPVKIALLFEHKSYPDEWVDFQMLRYQVNLWQSEFAEIVAERAKAENKRDLPKRQLAPILVLLVYHGKDEWKISLRFARHLAGMSDPESDLAKALAPYVPDFQPHFVNLTAMSDAEIQGEIFTRLFMLVLKHIFEHGLGGQLDEILVMAAEVIRQPNGMAMVVALLRYLGRAGIKVDKEVVTQKLLALLPKEGGVLMQTMADEWIEEGRVIGEIQGRVKTLRTTILRILRRRFPSTDGLLHQIEQQLAQISNEAALDLLVDNALEIVVLPDFPARLQPFLPSVHATQG